jgi:hypothetical protein
VKLNNSLKLFFLFFFLTLITSFYSLNGGPIWDDRLLIFNKDFNLTYQGIKFFQWFLYRYFLWIEVKLFGDEFFYYHLVNVILHSFNAVLLYNLAKQFKIKQALFLTLLFLVHPVNVESISWINQSKTLFAFTFIVLYYKYISAYLFLNKRILIIKANIFYTISIFFKSSIVLAPLTFIFFLYRFLIDKRKGLFLFSLPYLLLLFSTVLLLSRNSDIFQLTAKTSLSEENTVNNEDPIFISIYKNFVNLQVSTEAFQSNNEIDIFKTDHGIDYLLSRIILPLKVVNHYISVLVIPFNQSPIYKKFTLNLKYYGLELIYLIVLFLIIVFKINSNRKRNISIASTYLLMPLLCLVPYLGIIPAPFMYLTYVADRHIYVIFPMFLIFIFKLFEKDKFLNYLSKWNHKNIITGIIIFILVVASYNYSRVFKSEKAFWDRVYKNNPESPLPFIYLSIMNKRNCHLKKSKFYFQKAINMYNKNNRLKKDKIYKSLLSSQSSISNCKEKPEASH